jgi:hypothetical protein
MIHRRPILIALLAASYAMAGPTEAKPALYRGEYSLSFLGFTVARAMFDSRIDERSYTVEGSVASAGLAALFDDTSGKISASGRFSGGTTRPELFRADYLSGKKPTIVDIRFAGGNVTKTTNIPPLKKRGSDWVPLGPGDLKSVADPIAATLVRAGSLREVCARAARLYDGELRADLTLGYVSTGKARVKGFDGETVTCRMRFKPVSGYRKGRRALDFLRTKSRITVAFAPLGKTGVYAPIHATVGTEIGTITVRAKRFEAVE